MQSTRLVVFDCDGTLADTQFIAIEAMRLAFKSVNAACPSRAEILKTYGFCAPEAIQQLLPSADPETQQKICAAYLDWHHTLCAHSEAQEAMFEGAAGLLALLCAQDNILLGIATGKSRRGVFRFLAQNGLEGIFSTIQTCDDAPSKPHPAMLQKAMDEVGVDPEFTYMIGDTTVDIMMASRASVAGIGVNWGHQSALELRQAGAIAVAETFSDLSRILMLPPAKPVMLRPRIVAA